MTLVRLDRRDGVATITLDDPTRRNAITLPMCDELAAVLDDVEADADIGAVVVTGQAPAFCAGADLSHLGDSEEEGLLAIYEGFLRVGRCPLPTIAAVNGAAVGAGMNLALICDVRLAGRSARFDDRFLQLGIHPGGGHTYMLQNLTGPQTAAAAVLFGEILDGEAAERVGLVWRCVDDAELPGAAQELAARAASAPRELVVRTKATMAAVRTAATHDDAVRMELVPQVWSARQPAFKEKLAALKAKISNR